MDSEELTSKPVLFAAAVLVLLVLYNVIAWLWDWFAPAAKPRKLHVGKLTPEALKYYNGYDMMKPIIVAVEKKLYDVTKDRELYGPGKKYASYAGFPITRALALDSTSRKDFNDDLTGLTEEQLERLRGKIVEFESSYDVVGELVEPRLLTLKELAQFDGTDPSKPILLSVQGRIFDVTQGKEYYGPDGVYPFAGKEVARAFALNSVELSDCTANLDGLDALELENLQGWLDRFNSKYPVVGKVVEPQEAS